MTIFDALLGVAVMNGPLWLIWIIAVVALLLSILVARHVRGINARVAAGALVFVLLVLVPFADGILGRVYFDRLCVTEAGAKTFERLPLPSEFWSEDLKPRFLKANGDLDREMLANRLREPAIRTPHTPVLGIEKRQYQVRDSSNDRVLGEVTTFLHWGGWIARNLATHPAAESCQSGRGATFWRRFYSDLFVPSEPSTKGR